MYILSFQAFSVYSAGVSVHLGLVLGVGALHDLNPLAALDLVSDCFPLEALGLQQVLDFRVHLQSPFHLVMVDGDFDGGAVQVEPDVLKGQGEEALEMGRVH